MGKIIAIVVALSLVACGEKGKSSTPAAPKKAPVAATKPAAESKPVPSETTAKPAKKTKKGTRVAKKSKKKTGQKPTEAKTPAVTSPDGGPRNDGPG